MLKVQDAPVASVCPAQSFVSVKSPVMAGVPKVTGWLPELVTVMVCGLLCVATACAANMMLVEESVMAGAWIVVAFSSGICQRPRP